MSVCIHGNLCKEIYKKTHYIHSTSCPNNCRFFEKKPEKVKNSNFNNKATACSVESCYLNGITQGIV